MTYTAYYSQNTFTVTYAPGTNGTISATSESVAENGHPANVPTVTANSGYAFTGWSKDGGTTLLSKADIEATTVTGNVTYTAYYSQNTFTVTYAAGANGTISATSESVAENGYPSSVPTVTANSGYAFTGWSKDGGTTLLSKADIEDTTVKGNVTYTAYYRAITVTTPSTPSGGGGGGSAPAPTNEDDFIEVYVNGKAESVGKSKTVEANDRKVTIISVDRAKLLEKLASQGQGTVIMVPSQGETNVIVAELDGQMIESLERKQAIVELRSSTGSYWLPASQIHLDNLAKQLGAASNQDITIRIEVAESSANSRSLTESLSTSKGFALVVPPVHFTVTAAYGDKTVEITKYSEYVERAIAIPEGTDRNKITTAIVVEPDETVRHVPTKVVLLNGKYYAKVNSLTNSTYALVWHPVEFKDVENNWAKQAINDMGSRMVIDGKGNGLFSPDHNITRAEFAAIVVRGLGLKLEQGATPFKDVSTTDWYNGAIHTAYAYGLINGYEDGTFRPNDQITREQAAVIMSKAIAMTSLKDKLPVVSAAETMRPFADAENVSSWAVTGMADCLQADIVSGRKGNELAPQAFITRAEVATMIQRLLQKSNLI
ncbi:S-layer homology domain-containing protein [Cohnella cholangitidis]|uniref:SLH domain-containing protein n=1 Tax=Cohnella cholangitidis TaxID=2598458 RepID=A0A7G5BXC1_9BACL|nr:S-layer homology domain-containing protein [Cohnella cholangitidis]QMV41605.1 hypothetical protein FPL14_10735 [Cohnella cholangitidis]